MSTPDVPLRIEFALELPGTPAQVWDAIATANGISSWLMPTELDEREGGGVTFHMGDGVSSSGEVTAWEPPGRLAYVEPDWAALSGHDGEPVGPLVTEFLVEASSGGTCAVRVVSSAFGTGADWEREFFDDMEKMWHPFFDNLRLYLTDFPGQQVTSLSSEAELECDVDTAWAALRQALSAGETGQPVEVRGVAGHVERLSPSPPPHELLVRLTGSIPGYLGFHTYVKGDGITGVQMEGYLFSPEAPAYVEREQPAWAEWLAALR